MLHEYSFKKMTVVLFVVGSLIIFSTTNKAQGTNNADFNLSKNAIANLNMGIESDNVGLRKNAVYFAGIYLVQETGEILVKQLRKEENSNLRILITKTLYLIGNDKYSEVINEVAENDSDPKVRKFASSIYSVIQLEKSMKVANINK